MLPYTIARKISDYRSEKLQGELSSALAIREILEEHEEGVFPEIIKKSLSSETSEIVLREWRKRLPIKADDYSAELSYALRMNEGNFTKFYEISHEFL